VPHYSGTALLTTGMHVVDPFSKKRRSPLDPVSRRSLIVLRGLSVSCWVPMTSRGLSVSHFFFGLALHKFTLVLPLRYITATTAVTLPVFVLSIAFRSPLMVSVAVLVTLIGRGPVDIKLKPKGLSNLRRLSTCNPMSLHPISYSLSESLLESSRERFLRWFLTAFLSPFFTRDSMASDRQAICLSFPPPSLL
jgi:hypothetical protein